MIWIRLRFSSGLYLFTMINASCTKFANIAEFSGGYI